MPPLAVARRFCATLILMGLLGAAPAKADIEKFMRQCDGKLCASFRASITIPDGWIEDKEATSYFNAQVLLPKGLDFEKAPAKIYAVARYNRDKRPIISCPTGSKIGRAVPKTPGLTSSMTSLEETSRPSCATRSKPTASRSKVMNCKP
jgi:hypothetical protein